MSIIDDPRLARVSHTVVVGAHAPLPPAAARTTARAVAGGVELTDPRVSNADNSARFYSAHAAVDGNGPDTLRLAHEACAGPAARWLAEGYVTALLLPLVRRGPPATPATATSLLTRAPPRLSL